MVLTYNVASKAALNAITVCFLKARVEYTIPINPIGAGFVNMPFHKKTDRVRIEDGIKHTTLKRTGGSFAIAKMLLFWASGAGNYLIGEVFMIAGVDQF